MKVLRIILILLGLLVLLLVGIGLFGPTGMDVSYTQKLDAPISSVYGHVQDFKKWPEWSPWAAEDPDMKVTYGEISAGKGASYAWDGPIVKTGEMEIREVKINEELGMDIGFDTGDGMQYSTCDMLFSEVEGGTEVTWKFNSTGNDGFFERLMNVVMPSFLTGMYEKGLTKLGAVAKENPIASIKSVIQETGIMEKDIEGFYYVGKRHADINIAEQKPEDMQAMYGASFMQIGSYMGASGNAEKLLNPPISITYSYDKETTLSTFSPAMKVTEEVAVTDDLECLYMKGHKAMVCTHMGSYDNISSSYEKTVKILMSKGYTVLSPSYEIYVVDPGAESNPDNWKTEIIIPFAWNE